MTAAPHPHSRHPASAAQIEPALMATRTRKPTKNRKVKSTSPPCRIDPKFLILVLIGVFGFVVLSKVLGHQGVVRVLESEAEKFVLTLREGYEHRTVCYR